MTPRIMVFKHDPTTLEMIVELLEGEGYQVTHHIFTPGQRPMQLVEGGHPDLLITDHIPHRGAAEWAFVEALQRHPGNKTIPLIICTTHYDRAQHHIDALHLPHTIILEEPFPIALLLEEVTKFIGKAS